MSLALSTLIYEWRRYMAAVVALAFAGLLILALLGLFMGIGKSFSASIDRSRADVFILGPKAEGLDGASGVPRRVIPQIYMHPEVVEAVDLDSGGGMFTNQPKDGGKPKQNFVRLVSVDPRPGAANLPTDYSEQVRQALLEPYALVVDVTALKALGVEVGDKATYNGRTVKIAATITGYSNFFQPQLVASRDTLRLLGQASDGPRVGPLLVKIRDPSRAEQVAEDLNRVSEGRYKAWTRPELAKANQDAMFQESFIVVMLGFALVIGALSGVIITWQTLQGAVLGNIKEFASLRALGVSMGPLRWVVIELSFWVGIAGLFATAILTSVVTVVASANSVSLYYPLWAVAAVSVFLMIVSMVSGMLSVGVLKKSQPADLLR